MSTWVELIWGVVQQMISMVLTEANMFQENPGTHSFSEKTVRKKIFLSERALPHPPWARKRVANILLLREPFLCIFPSLCPSPAIPLLSHDLYLMFYLYSGLHPVNTSLIWLAWMILVCFQTPWKLTTAGLWSGTAIFHLILFISQELENKLTDHYSPPPTSKLGEGTGHGQ